MADEFVNLDSQARLPGVRDSDDVVRVYALLLGDLLG